MNRYLSGVRNSCLAAAVLACSGGEVLAGERLSNQSFSTTGWTLIPIVDDFDVVTRMLAVRDDTGAFQNGVSGLLYELDAQGDWSAQAWDAALHEDMLAWVIDEASLDADEALSVFPHDLDEQFFDDALLNPTAPRGFSNGLFTDDPLQAVVQVSPDPGPMLVSLENSGYPAVAALGGAPVAVSTSSSANTAAGVANCMSSDSDLVAAVAAALETEFVSGMPFAQALVANCGTCVQGKTSRVNPSAVTRCGGWFWKSGPTANGGCTAYCVYERWVTTTQTKSYTIICEDCTTHSCEQYRTRTDKETKRGTTFSTAPLCDASTVDCDAGSPPASGGCSTSLLWFYSWKGKCDADVICRAASTGP